MYVIILITIISHQFEVRLQQNTYHLTNQVGGLYCKLQTEQVFFLFIYDALYEDPLLSVQTKKTRLESKDMYYFSEVIRCIGKETS